MPEGDTIFRAARTLHRALAGKTVTRFESVYPAVTRMAEDRGVVGRTIESVGSRGKHLLMTLSGDLVLHTHMRMNGSWHLYPAGGRWQRPARDMRILVATADAVAVGFNVPVVELLSRRDLARHRDLSALGREAIGDVLLNQRVVAGIGNVFKSEILFEAGIDPFTPVEGLSDAALQRVLDIARNQLSANVIDRSQTLVRSAGRRTTRSLDPDARLWVYARGGRPCRRCGTSIRAQKTGVDARLTYWCPCCQPPR